MALILEISIFILFSLKETLVLRVGEGVEEEFRLTNRVDDLSESFFLCLYVIDFY